MNREGYKYYSTDLPFVKLGVKTPNTFTDDETFTVHSALAEVLQMIRNKRPKWEFYGHQHYWNKDARVSQGSLYVDGQELGTLSIERYISGKSEFRYNYDNERLRAERNRGWTSRTVDPKKAVREILKAFYPKTDAELINEAMASGLNRVGSIINHRRSTFGNTYSRLMDAYKHQIMVHWDKVVDMLPSTKLPSTDKLPELYADYEAAEHLSQIMSAKQYHHLIVLGSTYFDGLKYGDQPSPDGDKAYTDDTLPDHLRRSMGVLKLTDVGTFLPEFGVRTGENSYLIPKETTK